MPSIVRYAKKYPIYIIDNRIISTIDRATFAQSSSNKIDKIEKFTESPYLYVVRTQHVCFNSKFDTEIRFYSAMKGKQILRAVFRADKIRARWFCFIIVARYLACFPFRSLTERDNAFDFVTRYRCLQITVAVGGRTIYTGLWEKINPLSRNLHFG